jgi:hypothetical protein
MAEVSVTPVLSVQVLPLLVGKITDVSFFIDNAFFTESIFFQKSM